MQRNILFGIAHSANHNNTEFVRGLFEVEDQFFFFSPEGFRCSHSIRPHLVFPEHGDIIAFLPSCYPGEENCGFQIFDQFPGVKQIRVGEIIGVETKPLMPLPKSLLTEKHRSDELIDAVKKSDVQGGEKLLEDGADPDSSDKNESSALLHSIAKENIELTTLLISFGANPNKFNLNGISPVNLAKDRFKKLSSILDKAEQHITTVNWLKNIRQHPMEYWGFEEI